MVTGRVPFEGETSLAIVLKHRTETPRSPKALNAQIPDELNRLILRCLEKNKERRYQSAAEVLADLSSIEKGFPTTSGEIAGRKTFGIKLKGKKRIYVYTGAAVLLIAAALSLWLLVPKAGGDVLDSIAVLPIVNSTGDPAQQVKADWLTDMLISDLYKIKALRTPSFKTVGAFKNTKKSLKEIAKGLHVKALVEANMYRLGNQIQLIVRLVNAKDEQIWTNTYEYEEAEILFLKRDVSQAIVGEIKVAVTPAEKTVLASAYKVDPKASDLYAKCHYAAMDSPTTISATRINLVDCLKKVIDIDPNFALAHSFLGQIYWELGGDAEMSEQEAYPKAEAAVKKALELDETLGEAHASLAWLKSTLNWDFPGAEKEFRRALELSPGNWYIQFSYMVYLGVMSAGRFDEALAIGKKGENSPAQDEWPWSFKIAQIYLQAGRYDEAIDQAIKAAKKEPRYYVYQYLADAYASKGMYTEALSYMDKVMATPGTQDEILCVAEFAWILARAGRREDALKTMERLKNLFAKKNIDSSYWMAYIYAGLGDKDQAFKLLNEAYEKHSGFLITLKIDFPFHFLHDDPRFKELVKKVGLDR